MEFLNYFEDSVAVVPWLDALLDCESDVFMGEQVAFLPEMGFTLPIPVEAGEAFPDLGEELHELDAAASVSAERTDLSPPVPVVVLKKISLPEEGRMDSVDSREGAHQGLSSTSKLYEETGLMGRIFVGCDAVRVLEKARYQLFQELRQKKKNQSIEKIFQNSAESSESNYCT